VTESRCHRRVRRYAIARILFSLGLAWICGTAGVQAATDDNPCLETWTTNCIQDAYVGLSEITWSPAAPTGSGYGAIACVEATISASVEPIISDAVYEVIHVCPDCSVQTSRFTVAPITTGRYTIAGPYSDAGEGLSVSFSSSDPGEGGVVFTLTATMPSDSPCGVNPSTVTTGGAYAVVKVDFIEADSPVADNGPQEFEGHKTDFGDPCAATDPGQALIIFYDDVVDASYQVQDFDIDLTANVLPASITHDQLSEEWKKATGPNSGTFDRTDTFSVKYQNPKVGGLYQFEFDLGLGCPVSGANILLPLAGADMSAWLNAEAKAIGAWADSHRIDTEAANYSPIPFVTMYNVYRTWCSLSASFFDYVFDPIDAQQQAPCRRFQPWIGPGGHYGYVTVNGVVVHASKINNMLWGLFGRYWGWSETSLRLGAHLNQLARTLRTDGETSQNAIALGAEIYNLLQSSPSADIRTVLTESNLRKLVDPNDLDEEKLWPSPYPADSGNSTFVRPWLPTTP